MSHVFITTEGLRNVPGKHVDLLESAGHTIGYPTTTLVSEEHLLEVLDGCDAVMAANEPFTERVLSAFPRLRVVARRGVGYDNVDVEAATRLGIAVTITPQANFEAVAEHTIALLLAVARSIVPLANTTRQGNWPRRSVFLPLRGKTLGIVGYGRIGRAVAARAKVFGLRILVCENCPPVDPAMAQGVELVDLDRLLAESDFVSLHVPMTTETERLMNTDTIGCMKRGSILINTARGGLIDEAALVAALESKHLAGAGLDVLAVEPPTKDHPLLARDNVIVTPHVASFDQQALADMTLGAAACIAEILAGRWPDDCLVNPEVKPLLRGD